MKIFIVAYCKLGESGYFQRVHFYSFYSTLKDALERAEIEFCDEEGYYNGFIVEEKIEGDRLFEGIRVIKILNNSNKFEEIDLSLYRDVINLI